ncbi:trace amine-associated receptor 13c-like [Pygocentrus nattereri]|uniref:G-protein coupled receptors family 1 profile domain-containing protein n=1 Tax=Pygocentrus nattereri TaxID=42514 RepID=A0AAR2K2B3_PYGNA|nr:trace amine-associated receptor 13c-like [Pygocentrus nattereri]
MNNSIYRQNLTIQYCFPGNNASCRKEVRTGPVNVFLIIFLSCVSVCTVFLNLLVIISISHFKQLRTPTNLLILSLAVADLLVGLFVMPVNIMQIRDSCWYLGKLACSIYPLINGVSSSASLCSLIFIAVDRYIAICDPLLYYTKTTVYTTTLFIVLGWSFALFYVIISLHFNDNFLQSQTSTQCQGECVLVIRYSWMITDLVVSFITPCSIILVLYSIIFHVARRQAKAVRAVRNGNSKKPRTKASSSSEAKAAKKLGTLIFVYLACWIPYYLSSLTVESLTSLSMVWTVFTWLIYMNSSVNPLMYAIFYPWFRASAKCILTGRMFQSSLDHV